VQLIHEIIIETGDPFCDSPDHILEGDGEMPAVTVGLETAGLDNVIGTPKYICEEKPAGPVKAGGLHLMPAAPVKFV